MACVLVLCSLEIPPAEAPDVWPGGRVAGAFLNWFVPSHKTVTVNLTAVFFVAD